LTGGEKKKKEGVGIKLRGGDSKGREGSGKGGELEVETSNG